MIETIQNLINNWIQLETDELDKSRKIIDTFARGNDISAEDVVHVMLYSIVDPDNYMQNETHTPQIIEDPNNTIIQYLKDSGCSEQFKSEASRLQELLYIQDIMAIAYNHFHDNIKDDRDVPISTTFYENMKWTNINLEQKGWGKEFKANRYN